MRIGEITKDNYTDYIKLFGGKSSKVLDEMMGKDKENKYQKTDEEKYEMLVKMGYVLEGMLHKEGDVSWKKIVPIDDDMKNKIHDLVKKEFIENNGMSDGEALHALTKDYIKNSSVNERASVAWTISQTKIDEAQRLKDIVEANNPNWKPGQAFDPSIFDGYVSGGIDIKA